ncbi:MAG TPA: hypothetical protein VFP56_10070 [Candidatus Limnocylindrales bacterium]|nr:hypothetical protein [Candidatus Limnocylindrales bacterium]
MRIPVGRLGLLFGLTAWIVVALAAATLGRTSSADAARGAPANRQALHDQMRSLWAGDHIVWTRCFIVSVGTLPENLPDTDATTLRLLANQQAIGDAFKPFYGDAAGEELSDLLTEHIVTAAELIAAAKAHDDDAFADASTRWYANAHDIAAFLNELNADSWPVAAVEALLTAHLDLTLEEAAARLAGEYAQDVAAYDKVHAQILRLADALSAGIIAQFPERFAR